MVGRHRTDVRIEPIGHQGRGRAVPCQHRDGGSHRLNRRELVLAAKRHEHSAGAYGGVKALHKPFLGTDIQIAHERGHRLLEVLRHRCNCLAECGMVHCGHGDAGKFYRAVCVEKISRHVHNGISVPAHFQAVIVGNDGDDRRLNILTAGTGPERVHIRGSEHNRHALLGLGDGQLCAVESVIFFGNGVQINFQTVGKFTDGDRYAACAEVVAALDQPGNVRVAEQALKLALFGRIALLHFRAALLQGIQRMGF